MKVAGLFSGIAGFELGLGETGHTTVITCENDPDAAAILQARRGLPSHSDIRTLTTITNEAELLTAGFPCQDLSQAGKVAGISGEHSSLISEVFRLLATSKTPWLLIENVPFMLRLHGGAALQLIVTSLEELGYRWAYRVVDTIAFGLPQRRRRVFLLASRAADPADVLLVDDVDEPQRATPDPEMAYGFYWTEGNRGLGWAIDAIPPLKGGSGIGIPAPPAILMPNGRIILPDIRDAERLNGFAADWTAPADTEIRPSTRWRLIGNAVSVPVAAWIGARLTTPGRYDRDRDLEPISGPGWPSAARSLGKQRVGVAISRMPILNSRPPLHEFLHYSGKALSAKAAQGFFDRVRRSNLRLPEGFLATIAAHIAHMRNLGGERALISSRAIRH